MSQKPEGVRIHYVGTSTRYEYYLRKCEEGHTATQHNHFYSNVHKIFFSLLYIVLSFSKQIFEADTRVQQ